MTTPLNNRWTPTPAVLSALTSELETLARRTSLTFGRPSHTPQAKDAARRAVNRMAELVTDIQRTLDQ